MEANISSSEPHKDGNALELLTLIVYTSFGVFGMIGNGLVLFVVVRVKELHDVTNLLIVNQSLIDGVASMLLLALFVLPLPPLPRDSPALARFLCAFWYTEYPFWATFTATTLNMVLLTLDRYLAVVRPLQHRDKMSVRRATIYSFIPWITGCVFTAYIIPLTRVEDGVCLRFLWPNEIMESAVGIFTFLTFFVTSFVAMALMYVRIFRVLREGRPAMEGGGAPHRQDFRDVARRNVVKTMFTLSVCYCIFWAPNYLLYLFYCLGGEVNFSGIVYHASVCTAFVNMSINPLVYCFQYRKFQRGLKVAFRCSRRSTPLHLQTIPGGIQNTSI